MTYLLLRIGGFLLFLCICLSAATAQQGELWTIERLEMSTLKFDEYSPNVVSNNLIYTSNAVVSGPAGYTNLEGAATTDLYTVSVGHGASWRKSQPWMKSIKTHLHEASVQFSEDGNVFFFTRSLVEEKSKDSKNVGIFCCRKIENKWQAPEPFPHNSSKYSLKEPTVDGTGKFLFFSSDIEGGEGGFDLYYSQKTALGWGPPVNLGKTVNTKGDEEFPFRAKDGRLYFSSNGHGGFGKKDMFFTENHPGKWTTPVNVGRPINSEHDDFSIYLDAQGLNGYFASNREGTADIFRCTKDFPSFQNCRRYVENGLCFRFEEADTVQRGKEDFRFDWDMGDGTILHGAAVRHCFEVEGTYSVKLQMVDTITGIPYPDHTEQSMQVRHRRQPTLISSHKGQTNVPLFFSANAAHLPTEVNWQFYWNFGDIELADGPEVSHIYTHAGRYEVSLCARDPQGLSDPSLICVNKEIIIEDGCNEQKQLAGKLPNSKGTRLFLVRNEQDIVETITTDEKGRFALALNGWDSNYNFRYTGQASDSMPLITTDAKGQNLQQITIYKLTK